MNKMNSSRSRRIWTRAASGCVILALAMVFIFTYRSARAAAKAATNAKAAEEATLLHAFAKMEPIDSHSHVVLIDPRFLAMLDRLHLHLVDIAVDDDKQPDELPFKQNIVAHFAFAKASHGHAVVCTTFDPYRFNDANFDEVAIQQLNRDFARGAVAVKIWKNIGMEIKDSSGHYILPDNPRLEPIYKDISAHDKTLIAHVADPPAAWGIHLAHPNPNTVWYYNHYPQWKMVGIPGAPSRQAILSARDHLVAMNPHLRVVGAHFGSMATNVDEIAETLAKYPNFAVDTAARVFYLATQPREKVRAFMIKYQDRILYGTDNELQMNAKVAEAIPYWESRYAQDWRFFATTDHFKYDGYETQGLGLPRSVLKKLYHDNAIHWFPGTAAKLEP